MLCSAMETEDIPTIFSSRSIETPVSRITDPLQAATTRRRILERTAGERALLLPAHFMPPAACHIDETADGFRFEFVDP
jgi:hypothetical protein